MSALVERASVGTTVYADPGLDVVLGRCHGAGSSAVCGGGGVAIAGGGRLVGRGRRPHPSFSSTSRAAPDAQRCPPGGGGWRRASSGRRRPRPGRGGGEDRLGVALGLGPDRRRLVARRSSSIRLPSRSTSASRRASSGRGLADHRRPPARRWASARSSASSAATRSRRASATSRVALGADARRAIRSASARLRRAVDRPRRGPPRPGS